SHPDIVWFPLEKNKQIPIGKEDNPEEFSIRWLIRTRLYYRPHLSKIRFITIPDYLLFRLGFVYFSLVGTKRYQDGNDA
ncbi:hypothetical protein EHQ64_08420, partial [Leptospira sarikeiensis]